ncbi:MAG: restriction endonuclease subunit S [Thermodesulfobacteriota bacterium]|nr:restriction endonuclease subunit S [Thermodesulfobacteriota bacterium]
MLNSENLSESLPKNWALVKLDNICEILDRQRIPVNASDRDDRIAGKNENQLFPYYGATGQVGWIDDYLFKGEHILLGEDGAPFLDAFKDKAYIVNGRFWVNNHVHILKSYGSNKFLCHYLNQLDYGYFVTGTTRLKLNQASMKQIPVKVPPLLEQHRIVAKIEELFSELDNGIESLKKAREQLKTYRQAVLKYAFEGKLTKQWRTQHLPAGRQGQAGNPPEPVEKLLEQIKTEREKHYQQQIVKWKQAVTAWKANGEKGKKPTRISRPKTLSKLTFEETEIYGELPTSWRWSTFCNVTYKVGDIDHKMPKDFTGGLPYLSTGNLKEDGTIDFANAKTISKEDFKRLSLKIKPERGDIIFPRYGTIGRNILINFNKEFLVSYSCAIIKNIPSLMNGKFVYYYSLSPVIKKEIEKYTVQTTQANIGIASIENFVFPLCSLPEQHTIVSEIESRLSVCNNLEQTIEGSLKKSEALRQSILKKAFEGELTREWRLPAGRQEKNGEVYIVENRSGKLMPKRKESHFVYVLECENSSIYKGVTSNLNKRINDHLAGIGAEWTKTHRPIALIHYEEFKSEKEAVEREKHLKSGTGREWLKELQKEKVEQYLSAEKLLEKIKAEKGSPQRDAESTRGAN